LVLTVKVTAPEAGRAIGKGIKGAGQAVGDRIKAVGGTVAITYGLCVFRGGVAMGLSLGAAMGWFLGRQW